MFCMDIQKLELFERLKIFLCTSTDFLHGYRKARVIRTAQDFRSYFCRCFAWIYKSSSYSNGSKLSLVQLTADFLHGYTSGAHGWRVFLNGYPECLNDRLLFLHGKLSCVNDMSGRSHGLHRALNDYP